MLLEHTAGVLLHLLYPPRRLFLHLHYIIRHFGSLLRCPALVTAAAAASFSADAKIYI
jgi:hypothetical protein